MSRDRSASRETAAVQGVPPRADAGASAPTRVTPEANRVAPSPRRSVSFVARDEQRCALHKIGQLLVLHLSPIGWNGRAASIRFAVTAPFVIARLPERDECRFRHPTTPL